MARQQTVAGATSASWNISPSSWARGPWVPVVGVAALLALIYGSTLVDLAARWNRDPNYSHGYLIPPACVFLLAHRRMEFQAAFAAVPRQEAYFGGAVLLTGMSLRWATSLFASLFLECASLQFSLAGLTLLLFGRRGWAASAPAWTLLWFAVPWPAPLYGKIAFPLQLLVSECAAMILDSMGVPAFCEGALIHLPGRTMHVAEACSGLRQLTAFLAIGACMAMLPAKPMWSRVAVLAASVPVAVAANIARVTATGVLTAWGYSHWLEGAWHQLEGLMGVAVGLAMMSGVSRVLDWLTVAPADSSAKGVG